MATKCRSLIGWKMNSYRTFTELFHTNNLKLLCSVVCYKVYCEWDNEVTCKDEFPIKVSMIIVLLCFYAIYFECVSESIEFKDRTLSISPICLGAYFSYLLLCIPSPLVPGRIHAHQFNPASIRLESRSAIDDLLLECCLWSRYRTKWWWCFDCDQFDPDFFNGFSSSTASVDLVKKKRCSDHPGVRCTPIRLRDLPSSSKIGPSIQAWIIGVS